MVTDWKTILSLPLKAAPKFWPLASLEPRRVVTRSSRARRTRRRRGDAGDGSDDEGLAEGGSAGDDEVFPAKKAKLPRTRTLSTKGSTIRPNMPSTFQRRAR